MSLRVLTLSPDPLIGPSPRYRLYAYQEPLRAQGIELDIRPFLTHRAFQLRMNGARHHPLALARVAVALLERVRQARTARQEYDLLYIHRQAVPFAQRFFDGWFLEAGLPIAFDMDDAVFHSYPIDHLLRGSAAVTVGNEYLAAYARCVAPEAEVTVIPTVVDTTYYRPRPERPPHQRAVVGWIGTSSTFSRYLQPVLAGLVEVCRTHGAEFHVIASTDTRAAAEQTGAVFVPWALGTELQSLQSLDVGVMPLSDDEYVLGKCAFKLIEYGAVGLPSVGSAIGANHEVIHHGRTGFLASTPAAFEQELAAILQRPDLGRSLGMAARQVIEQRFSLHTQVDVMERVLRQAAAKGQVR